MLDLKEYEIKMDKTIESLDNDFNAIRAGRANPRILDRVTVDYYGVETPLNQLSNITVPEARLIQIQPFDANSIKDIERAIQISDIGINPNNDGKVIRLVFPELTEDRRVELTREIKRRGDDSKISIRNIRREAMDYAQGLEDKGDLSEDVLKKVEKDIQDLTDKYTDKIDTMVDDKSKDIMSI